MRVHLITCPASVVACTQEWNRFPLHCQDRYKTIPFRQRNPRATRGQLDYELSLRDQNMVRDFSKVPRKTKLALRNNLTRRYPALPLPLHSNRNSDPRDKSLKSLREAARFEVGDDAIVGAQYGIAKLFLKNQEKQTKRWQEDVDRAIQRTGQPIPKKYWEHPELERGDIHEHCAYCFNINCDKEFKLTSDDRSCCSMTTCSFGCGANFHLCKSSEHKMICPMFEEESEFDWVKRTRLVRDGASDDKLLELARFKKKAKKAPPPKPFPDLLMGPTLSVPDPPKYRGRIPPAPPPPPKHEITMGFDIKIESVTRLQQKPKSMYTFLCGAELRRDQWEYHCKNVHSDIHGSLNNWMEARCPLASYGCGFSMRRLYPGVTPGAEVVYSQAVKSFGVKPPIVTFSGKSFFSLTSLPTELVQYIFSFLDSWSLSSIALSCHLLRDVACSLLEEKGCVALQWEKVPQKVGSGRVEWEVAYKRWFFSSHFQPVHHWTLNTDGAISEHLKTCPYFIKTIHQKQDKSNPQNKKFIESLNLELKQKKERASLLYGN